CGMATLTTGTAGRAFGVAAALGLLLSACTSTSTPRLVSLPPVPQTASQPDREPATQREHARILASYGGEYDNPRLRAMIEKTVDRLVAASERPDLKYQ